MQHLDKVRILIISVLLLSFTIKSDFLTEQKKFERVRTTIREKSDFIEDKLHENNLTTGQLNLLMVAYKESNLLEIYGKNKTDSSYQKILSYEICSRSGELGPKKKQGDRQVPEGFYFIQRFNPTSNYYLSLGISYPNLADRRKNKTENLGGDIFIHGSCVTIGCLPMTDDKIKEIYLLAVHARNNGQLKIPVYIFPFEMTEQNMVYYKKHYKEQPELIQFWENLKIGYDQFRENPKELKIEVSPSGNYRFL